MKDVISSAVENILQLFPFQSYQFDGIFLGKSFKIKATLLLFSIPIYLVFNLFDQIQYLNTNQPLNSF